METSETTRVEREGKMEKETLDEKLPGLFEPDTLLPIQYFEAMRKKGHRIETLALFHEDTIFGTDSANAQTKLAAERGYRIVADIKYRANSPSTCS